MKKTFKFLGSEIPSPFIPKWKINVMRLMFWKYKHYKTEDGDYHFKFLLEKKGGIVILIKEVKVQ